MASFYRREDLCVRGLDLIHVAGDVSPVHREAVSIATRKYVQVQVKHRLPCALPIRLNHVDAIRRNRRLDGACDAPGRRDGRREYVRRRFEQVRIVRLRYGERVPRIARIDIHEGQRLVVLPDFEARNISGNDFAEDAVGVVRSLGHADSPSSKSRPAAATEANGFNGSYCTDCSYLRRPTRP